MELVEGLSKREFTEQFVQKVKMDRYLWDRTSSGYKDNSVKDRHWEQLSATFSMSNDNARKKWKGLRDRYVKEKRAYDKEAGRGGKPAYPRWHLYQLLDTFLGGTVVHRDGTHDASDSSTSFAQDDLNDNDNSVTEAMPDTNDIEVDNNDGRLQLPGSSDENEKNNKAPSKTFYYCKNPSFSNSLKFKKRKLLSEPIPTRSSPGAISEDGARRIVEMLDVANRNLKKIAVNSDKGQDELDYYFRSLLERVRKLPSSKQRHARLKFETVLFEIEEEHCET